MSYTESLRQSRLMVVAVDKNSGRLRLRGAAEACSDVVCSEATLVVSEQGESPDLGALGPGDIVRLEGEEARPARIVVLRRASDEISSPEW